MTSIAQPVHDSSIEWPVLQLVNDSSIAQPVYDSSIEWPKACNTLSISAITGTMTGTYNTYYQLWVIKKGI